MKSSQTNVAKGNSFKGKKLKSKGRSKEYIKSESKLAGYNLSEEERKETETALDQLLFMTITFFDDME